MKKYLILTDTLPDGKYMTSKTNWHQRLRLKLAYWLYNSIHRKDPLEIKTESGVAHQGG